MDFSNIIYPLINGNKYTVEFNDEDEKIRIGKSNECSICGKYYKYDWGFRPLDHGLFEARVLTEHPKCRIIRKKIDKMREELTELEYRLFCLKC
jgi:hypothetical protein